MFNLGVSLSSTSLVALVGRIALMQPIWMSLFAALMNDDALANICSPRLTMVVAGVVATIEGLQHDCGFCEAHEISLCDARYPFYIYPYCQNLYGHI